MTNLTLNEEAEAHRNLNRAIEVLLRHEHLMLYATERRVGNGIDDGTNESNSFQMAPSWTEDQCYPRKQA